MINLHPFIIMLYISPMHNHTHLIKRTYTHTPVQIERTKDTISNTQLVTRTSVHCSCSTARVFYHFHSITTMEDLHDMMVLEGTEAFCVTYALQLGHRYDWWSSTTLLHVYLNAGHYRKLSCWSQPCSTRLPLLLTSFKEILYDNRNAILNIDYISSFWPWRRS